MQPPARIRSVLLSDRRIFKQGLFIMKTVRGTLPRLVFCGKFNIQIKVFARRIKFSPAKKHKETFRLSYFSVTKSTKSHQRELSPLFDISSRVHELVAGSSAWQVRAAQNKAKIGGFALSAISYYHACEHIARESRADSCTHCLHAR